MKSTEKELQFVAERAECYKVCGKTCTIRSGLTPMPIGPGKMQEPEQKRLAIIRLPRSFTLARQLLFHFPH
jgi:hypothetical protein